MCLKRLLPCVALDVSQEPSVCPYGQCGGERFHRRQAVRDTVYAEVTA